MLIEWTKHLKDPKEKADFEQYILSSRPIIERFEALIDEREKALSRAELDVKIFDQPNWEYRQAYQNGFRACLGIMKKLTNLDQRTQDNK